MGLTTWERTIWKAVPTEGCHIAGVDEEQQFGATGLLAMTYERLYGAPGWTEGIVIDVLPYAHTSTE